MAQASPCSQSVPFCLGHCTPASRGLSRVSCNYNHIYTHTHGHASMLVIFSHNFFLSCYIHHVCYSWFGDLNKARSSPLPFYFIWKFCFFVSHYEIWVQNIFVFAHMLKRLPASAIVKDFRPSVLQGIFTSCNF